MQWRRQDVARPRATLVDTVATVNKRFSLHGQGRPDPGYAAVLMVHERKVLSFCLHLYCFFAAGASYARERSHKTNIVFTCLEPSETVTTKII